MGCHCVLLRAVSSPAYENDTGQRGLITDCMFALLFEMKG